MASYPNHTFAGKAKHKQLTTTRCLSDNLYKDALDLHYANIPVQYTAIFHGCKNDNFQLKYFDYFHIFAQNIDFGYTLELPQ